MLSSKNVLPNRKWLIYQNEWLKFDVHLAQRKERMEWKTSKNTKCALINNPKSVGVETIHLKSRIYKHIFNPMGNVNLCLKFCFKGFNFTDGTRRCGTVFRVRVSFLECLKSLIPPSVTRIVCSTLILSCVRVKTAQPPQQNH